MYKFNTDLIKESLVESDYPKSVVVEATSYCNLKCSLCPQSTLKRPKGNMELDIFKKIVDEISTRPLQPILWLAIMGEPLIQSKNLISMIKYSKKVDIKEVCLNTNAILLTPEISEDLIRAGLDKLLISLDGFNPGTYEKIRIGGNYKLLLKNIDSLLEINKKYKDPLEVIVQFIVTEDNQGEVQVFKDFWLTKKVTVKIRPKLSWGKAIESSFQSLKQEDRTYPCPWLIREASILWDGRFSQCDGDYEGEYSPGSINTQTIYEVWNTELKSRRNKHWEGDFTHPLCKECRDWQVGKAEFYKGVSNGK